MKKILVILLCLIPLQVLASGKSGTTSGDILLMGASADAIAMGEAYSYTKNNVNAMLYNPASLAWIKNFQVSALYQSHIADINYDTLNIGIPLSQGGIGLSVKTIFFPDIYENVVEGGAIIAKTKLENLNELAFSAGYGSRIWDNLQAGLNVKYYYSRLVDYSASSILADIGFTYGIRYYSLPSGKLKSIKEISSFRDLEVFYTTQKYDDKIQSAKSEKERGLKEIDEQIKELDQVLKRKDSTKAEKIKSETRIEFLKNSISKQNQIKEKEIENLAKIKQQELRKLYQYYNNMMEDFDTQAKLSQLKNEGQRLQFMKEANLKRVERYFNDIINQYNIELLNFENEINLKVIDIDSRIETLKNDIIILQKRRETITSNPISRKSEDISEKKTKTAKAKKKAKSEEIEKETETAKETENKTAVLSPEKKEELVEIDNEIKEKEVNVKDLVNLKEEMQKKLSLQVKKVEKMIKEQKMMSEGEKSRVEETFKRSLTDARIKKQVRFDIEQKYEINKLRELNDINETISKKIEDLNKERDNLLNSKVQSINLLQLKLRELKSKEDESLKSEIKKIESEIQELERTYGSKLSQIASEIDRLKTNIDSEKSRILVNNFYELLQELVEVNMAGNEENTAFYKQQSELRNLDNQYSKYLVEIEVNKKLGKKVPDKLLIKQKEYETKMFNIKQKYYGILGSKKYEKSESDIIKLREASLGRLREELKNKLQNLDASILSQSQDIYLERLKFDTDRKIQITELKYENKMTKVQEPLKTAASPEKEKLTAQLNKLADQRDKEIASIQDSYQEEMNDFHRNVLRKENNIFFTLSVLNIGSDIKYASSSSPMPMTLRGGVGAYIMDNFRLGVEYAREIYEEKNYICLGTEYKLFDLFPLRAGYQVGKENGAMSLGTGLDTDIRLGLTKLNIVFSYTYTPISYLSDQHSIGLIIRKQ
ncbi:MAG: hypothetical protein JW827_05400 [Spirochaetes bacterium]|nr:hypothetical protein [Spirochaetota bacterium]